MISTLIHERAQLLTSPLRGLPDFLFIGPQFGGTAKLFDCICTHPEVLPPRKHEIGYFTRHFRKGEAWYRSHFPIRTNGHLTGEASTDYVWDWHTADRVRALMPDAKIVAVLRDPVDRAWSHYQTLVRNGVDLPDFEEALDIEQKLAVPLWMKRRIQLQTYQELPCLYSFRMRGLYAEQLRRWRQYFSREQMLILSYEEFSLRPGAEYSKVLNFLGLSSHQSDLVELERREEAEMSPNTRDELIAYYREPNEQLFQLIGRRYAWAR